MWKFLSPFTCRTMRDFSSRSAGRGWYHRGMWGGTPWDGRSVLTVANDPSQGLPLEVKLHVHVLALRDGAGVRAGGPCGGAAAPLPMSLSPSPAVPPAPSGSAWPQQGPAPRDAAPPSHFPSHSRIGRSCHCGQSWRFQRLRGGGWGYSVVQGELC